MSNNKSEIILCLNFSKYLPFPCERREGTWNGGRIALLFINFSTRRGDRLALRPACFSSAERITVTIEWVEVGGGWASEAVWLFRRNEIFLALGGNLATIP
jgi:hypothetical protein